MLRASLPILALTGCHQPTIQVIPGVTSAVEVVLTNPTECPTCDPFEGIDTLRLDVNRGDEVLATDSYTWPGEDISLPDLDDFGVVRISLVGLTDGRVLSAGRTQEFAIPTAEPLSIPLVFLPINRALPLAAPMITPRVRHNALPRRDGTVLLLGGLDPGQTRVLNSIEVYDPSTGSFVEHDPLPTSSVADQVVVPLPDGASLLIGGLAVIGDSQVSVEISNLFDDTSGVLSAAGALNQGRYGHCVAMFRERQGLVLGGGAEPSADYLRPDDLGFWSYDAIEMRDFDADAVTGCAALGDGTVFVQGGDPASTGVWAGDAEGADPGAAFTPIAGGAAGDVRFVAGAAYLPATEGGMYILGGADVGTGEVYADSRLFSPLTGRFVEAPGFRRPRFDADLVPWMLDGWYAAGCGWADAGRLEEEPSFELLAPALAEGSALMALDRERPGCALSVLGDGSLLVTGGYGTDSGQDAALIIPWQEEASD